jgi:SAM-dependent methyltransferase
MMLHEDQTRRVAEDWKTNPYYDRAEAHDWLDTFWSSRSAFRVLFSKLDTRVLLELACGHGRHTEHILSTPELRHGVESIYLMDINEENIQFCKDRFVDNALTHPLMNSGWDFQPLGSGSLTAIFCYDAMVHFEYDAVQSYIEDAYRVLIPGGKALLHHSNYDRAPGGLNSFNPHHRNFMTKNLFAHLAVRAGFEICEQLIIHWGDFRNLDCISLIEKRRESDPVRSSVSSRSRLAGRILHKVLLRKIKRYLSAGTYSLLKPPPMRKALKRRE